MGSAAAAQTWSTHQFPTADHESRQRRPGSGQRGRPLTANDQQHADRANPLAGYEDWPDAVRSAEPYVGADSASTALARVLGLRRIPERPIVHEDGRQRLDGVLIRQLRWSVGYGPDTTAWLLHPAGVRRSLPGVLGMHCHGGVRSIGAEQLIDLGSGARPRAVELRASYYSGRAPASELARHGYAVLVHDTFSWASRRFDLSRPTPRLSALLEAQNALWQQQGVQPSEDERFDLASGLHEDTVAKAAGALGQTFAGAVLTDDLIALTVLASEDRVDPERLGTFGFSGGGGRSLLLAALDHRIKACVVSCMMATFRSLVPTELDSHSWLLLIPGLWSLSDWPDLTAMGQARFLVQYRIDDDLFPLAGMEAAHDHLQQLHAGTLRYQGSFSSGDHAFDAAMQQEAWAFLGDVLDA